jgi:hypothetical protein
MQRPSARHNIFCIAFLRPIFPRTEGKIMRNSIVLAAIAVTIAAPAWADPQALSTNVPVQIEDALPTPYGVMTLQSDNRFTHDSFNSRGSNGLLTEGVVKVGALPGLQVDIGPSYNIGNQSNADSGNATIDALYNFNNNSTYIPAFALHAYYQQPYGAGHQSQTYTIRAIATKYLGPSVTSPRFDINLTDYHLEQPSSTQRSDQLEIAVGLSALVTDDTAIVGDVVHGAKPNVGQVETLIDLGLRHQISGGWSISGGVGAGIAQQSPEVRVFFALQKDINLF